MRIRIEDNFSNEEFEKFRIIVEEAKDGLKATNMPSYSDITIIDAGYEDIVVKSDESEKAYETYYGNNYVVDKEVEEDLDGKIIVYSRLMSSTGTLISSAKINLYMLKGLSPRYIDTQYTDKDGCAVFSNLKKGSYRIIAIVDRKYFEKPTYISWNEVNIDKENLEATITVINQIKSNIKK